MEIKKKVAYFQEGGQMQLQGGAPEEQGEDPMAQLLQVATQAMQTQDCEAAMAVCQALVQLAQGGQGGEEQAPPEEPTFARKGAKLLRIK